MDHSYLPNPSSSRSFATRCLALLLVPCLGAAALAQAGTDSLTRANGSSVRGIEITAMTLAGVTYKQGKDKSEANLPGHEVVDVRWGNVPESFQIGLAALQLGNYETARQHLTEAVAAIERPALKAEARFLQGKAAVGVAENDPGAASNAIDAMRGWINDFADGWRLPEAMFLLGRAQRLGKAAGDSVTTLKGLDERATREAWNPVWSIRAKYELGLSLIDDGKVSEARGAFQAAASAAQNAIGSNANPDPELQTLKVNARVGEGETLVGDKEYSRALEFFRGLANGGDPALAAAGRAGEGQTLFLMNEGKNDAAALRASQLALADACVRDTGAGEAAAKANYYLGRVLRALGDRDGNEFKARSDAYFQIVARNYSGTRWAALARAEIAK